MVGKYRSGLANDRKAYKYSGICFKFSSELIPTPTPTPQPSCSSITYLTLSDIATELNHHLKYGY